VEGLLTGPTPGGHRLERRYTRWLAPDQVRGRIASETVSKVIEKRMPPIERIEESTRMELVSFKQG
jgi:hypothetical protein